MKDDEDIVDEWMNINFFDTDSERFVYVTILEYIDQAKELCSL